MAVTLSINGRREEIEPGQTLSAVLEAKRVRPEVSVVYLNKSRLERDVLATTVAEDGDTIEVILQFAGGSDA